MEFDLFQKSVPFPSRFSVVHKKVGTVFVSEILPVAPDPPPVLVGHHSRDWDVVFFHQKSSQPSRSVEGFLAGVSLIFAHFDSDGITIPGSFIVSVLPLLVGRQGLVNATLVNRCNARKVCLTRRDGATAHGPRHRRWAPGWRWNES